MTTGDTGWSEYWEKDGAEGEVFVNAKGDAHPALAKYWAKVFAAAPPACRILDVASGAGSIFAHLPTGHGFKLHATDIASEALEVLTQRIPGVGTTVSPAEDMPFDDGSFDLVVSQFGIEYAGPGAFDEAARVVAPDGRLVALAHVKDGYIDSNNKSQLDEALVAQESGFIEEARKLTKVAFGKSAEALSRREQAILPAIKALGLAVQRCRRGVHAYLLAGFRELYENRQQYDAADIIDWLDGMQAELEKTIDRLSRMRAAALSTQDVDTISESLGEAGFTDIAIRPFVTPGNELPVAWDLSARRENQV